MVSIIFLVCIPLYHRYPCRISGLPVTLAYSIIVPADIVLWTWPLVCCIVHRMVRDAWLTRGPAQVLLSPSQGVHNFCQVIDSTSGPRAMIITAAYVCVTLYVLQNALLTIVFFSCGPWTWSHVTESFSSLPHSLLWAHGSNFSFSVLGEFTKQMYAQKSDLNGDMNGSLFHLSFCLCWLFSPLILNFRGTCFCVKNISLTWKR